MAERVDTPEQAEFFAMPLGAPELNSTTREVEHLPEPLARSMRDRGGDQGEGDNSEERPEHRSLQGSPNEEERATTSGQPERRHGVVRLTAPLIQAFDSDSKHRASSGAAARPCAQAPTRDRTLSEDP